VQTTILDSGLSAIAPAYRLILSDVWGVVHDGLKAHPEACAALALFRTGGGRVILISNAPRPFPSVVEQLGHLGVAADAYDAIVTSGDVSRTLIMARAGQKAFHIGHARDEPLFAGTGVQRVALVEADYVVCSGLANDETETVEDYRETLAACHARRLPMICANPDLVVERGHRLIVCAGALADAYRAIGGEVVYAGKPHRPIYDECLAKAATLGFAGGRAGILAIGDAIRTDVAGADALGLDCLFLAAGIHAAELIDGDGLLDESRLPGFLSRGPAPRYVAKRLSWS
jgi:HAD superfamily hydrolase (TIGR01459 family)